MKSESVLLLYVVYETAPWNNARLVSRRYYSVSSRNIIRWSVCSCDPSVTILGARRTPDNAARFYADRRTRGIRRVREFYYNLRTAFYSRSITPGRYVYCVRNTDGREFDRADKYGKRGRFGFVRFPEKKSRTIPKAPLYVNNAK